MWRLNRILARLRTSLSPHRAEREMEREMAAHLAMLEDEFRRRGMSVAQARRAARRKFGAAGRTRDGHRETRSFVWLDQLRQDLSFTFRTLAGNKGYTAAIVLTLALGIGANSAVFSVIHPLMMKPLPFDRPEQLVQFAMRERVRDGAGLRAHYPLKPEQAVELADRVDSISGYFQAYGYTAALLERGTPATANVAAVSEATFTTLRARPLLGRLLLPDDHAPGAEPVAVASYDAWRTYWSGDTDIVGRAVTLESTLGRARYRIVGVLPEDFEFPIRSPAGFVPPTAEFWTPGNFDGFGGTGDALTKVFRIRDSVTLAAAEDEINAVLAGMNLQTYQWDPESGKMGLVPAGSAKLVPIKAGEIERIRPALAVLVAAVGAVLLIACTNVANLMLGRTIARRREIAIRAAVGASRARLMRQTFTESLVLALGGGIAAMLVALGGVHLMTAWPGNARPGSAAAFLQLPRIDGIELDGAVFAFTFVIAIVTGVLFGLAPALAVSRRPEAEQIKDGGAGVFEPRIKRSRGRGALVVVQIALALTLLVAAGLLVQSFVELTRVDPGFSTDGVVTFEVTASQSRFVPTPPFGGSVPYFDELAERLRHLPGVESAGFGPPPLRFGGSDVAQVELPGTEAAPPRASLVITSFGYLDALGVPVYQGRRFRAADGSDSAVILVNRAFVRQRLGGVSPIGHTARLSFGVPDHELVAEVVGVVDNVRQGGLDIEPYPQVFLGTSQAAASGIFDIRSATFVARTSDPAALMAGAEPIVRELDKEARVENFMPLEQLVAESIRSPRFFGELSAAFAVIGVILAALGLYAVMSYTVTQRTREIGIRMALGAGRGSVLGMVLRQGAVLSLVGIALGLIAALAGSRSLEAMLFGIEPLDATTFGAVALGLFAVAMAATVLPARRASVVDPLVSLRHG